MTDRELLEQWLRPGAVVPVTMDATRILVEALRARLAQPEPEPWGYISHKSWKMPVFVEADNLEVSGLPFNNPNYTPVYKAPPQREWQGLTDEEIKNHWLIAMQSVEGTVLPIPEFALAIERALKEKNHG